MSLASFRVMYSGRSYDVKADKGQSLLTILRERGFNINSFCGGTVSCGKCKVMISPHLLRLKRTDGCCQVQSLNGAYALPVFTRQMTGLRSHCPITLVFIRLIRA